MNVVCRVFFAVLVALTACGGHEQLRTPPPDSAQVPTAAPLDGAPAPLAAPAINPMTAASTADVTALAASHNDFGIDLWKRLSADHAGNLALSPASLALAFGMVEAGAAGDTRAELRKVLHLDLPDARVHAANGALIAAWNAPAPYVLAVANRLFGEASTPFAKPFTDLVAADYGAPLDRVDFIGAANAARVHINDWVAGATRDKIKDLLPPGSIDAETRLVLTNAVYFKGQWASRFDPARTRPAPFKTPDGTVDVPMMAQAGRFAVGHVDGATLLELPYVSGPTTNATTDAASHDLTMVIALPDAPTTTALEARLSAATLATWTQSLRPIANIEVSLPRFRIATDSIALKEPLQALGLRDAFGPGADFSGMTRHEHLFISDAFHKVFVEVNEEGTEAAAATAVVMTRESEMETPEFRADHPFLFFLRDARTGQVLFMGRVTHPNA